MSIRVLLVDDHPVVRHGLRRMLELEKDMEVVAEAVDGEQALNEIGTVSPDIVLLDIRMPGMGGIETIRQIREHHPETNVMVLTMYGNQYLSQAIEAGAMGYLVKDVGNEDLIHAIRAVHRGQSILHPSLSRELFNEFASLAKGGNNYKSCLAPRELEIIRLIAAGSTNKEIAAQLFLSETTVKRSVSRILDKLESKDRAEAVSEAYKRGLI
ncbi:MAG: response regulator transcription factor [Dehalococcoidia bacterium]|jgi:DNA-binding NarL/FixJ family response regulator|nr:response regulator transcription factor [Chloroflexota bacterium]MCK4243041.1 response regulator transcription factor [Dehalococcoidia bacterium]MCK4722936.1 response regulator transcription factor [Dehalococcoidia bacterium]